MPSCREAENSIAGKQHEQKAESKALRNRDLQLEATHIPFYDIVRSIVLALENKRWKKATETW